MEFEQKPWSRQESSNVSPSRKRKIIWLILVIGIVIAISQLSDMFPNALSSDRDKARLIWLATILILGSGAVVFAKNIRVAEVVRNIALWVGVILVLILGYMYRDDLQEVGYRFRSELVPQYPVQLSARTATISADESGAFRIIGKVDGTRVTFLVDTGASDVVLSPADARRIGIDNSTLHYSRDFETAHGIGHGAQTLVHTLSVGPVSFHDVPISINQSPMSFSLLGMAFLKRLGSFEIHDRQLILHWPENGMPNSIR
jgi:aspartyl protease family protein